VPPICAGLGGVEVKWITWPDSTVVLWLTCGAAEKALSPAWLASMSQVPIPVKWTVPVVIEQAPEVLEP
jgi:hypothetical protein